LEEKPYPTTVKAISLVSSRIAFPWSIICEMIWADFGFSPSTGTSRGNLFFEVPTRMARGETVLTFARAERTHSVKPLGLRAVVETQRGPRRTLLPPTQWLYPPDEMRIVVAMENACLSKPEGYGRWIQETILCLRGVLVKFEKSVYLLARVERIADDGVGSSLKMSVSSKSLVPVVRGRGCANILPEQKGLTV
jgi:hypothetical protein